MKAGAGQLHRLAALLPHRGLLDAGPDQQRDQRRDDREREQPPPGETEPLRDQQVGGRGQQVAERVALLQEAGEEAAPLARDLLHRQRGAEAPLAAHADAVEQPEHDQDREVRRERAQEADGRVEQHVDDQRDPPPDPVRPEPEQQRADRPHQQRDRGQERDLLLRGAEVGRDVGVHQHDDEVVERVHRPAQQGGGEGVALVAGERRPPAGGRGHEVSPRERLRRPTFPPYPEVGAVTPRARSRRRCRRAGRRRPPAGSARHPRRPGAAGRAPRAWPAAAPAPCPG